MLSLINMNNATRWRHGASLISTALMVLALMAVLFKGLNWGLDFTGGVVSDVRMGAEITSAEVAAQLEAVLEQSVSVVGAGEPGSWQLRFAAPPAGGDYPPVQQMLAPLDSAVQVMNTSIVGPQVGQELAEQGGLALIVCLLAILIYLSFRFEWRQASGALFALVHDVVLVLGVLAFTQMEFNLTILAALLAIIGYSLNDSIVIADRVRELLQAKTNSRRSSKSHEPLDAITNRAIGTTLSRTLVTSGTTLITISALWLLGGGALAGFAATMFFGVLSGSWSSVTVGSRVPELLKLEPKHYQPAPVPVGP